MEAPRHEAAETDLVDCAARGDADAFEELFNRFYPMIYTFSYRISLNGCDAEDIAQETFIKAARSLAGFRGESSFKNWLYRIAANCAEDFRRALGRRERIKGELEAGAGEVERLRDHGRVAEALGGLSGELREAVVLVYYEGFNHAAAARILGCAETTVSWRVFKAKRLLRKVLERGEELEGGIF